MDGRFAAFGKPLVEHIADWEKVLLDKGNTPGHVARYKVDVMRIVINAKARYLADLTPSQVQRAIAAMREGDKDTAGLSLQTCNHTLRAVKSFSRWMVADQRTSEDALAHVKAFNVKTDRRHDRRSLSDDEIIRLLKTAENGPDREGVCGKDRAMLYRVALGTGFRRGELASLTPQSFKLDDTPATVAIAAAYSKHRRTDIQPIRPDLSAMLGPWLKGRPMASPVFAMPNHTSRMIREDLAAARAAWLNEVKDDEKATADRNRTDFLASVDAGGCVADFHALRHTYVTRLVQSGASVKVAQELARHSTPTLTLGRYAHIGLHDTSKAMDALPSLSPATPIAASAPIHSATPFANTDANERIPANSGGKKNRPKKCGNP